MTALLQLAAVGALLVGALALSSVLNRAIEGIARRSGHALGQGREDRA